MRQAGKLKQQIGHLTKSGPKIKYTHGAEFYRVLKHDIDYYFKRTGYPRRDILQVYLKPGLLLAWFTGSYISLLFIADGWWQAGLLAVSLGLAMAGIGFNIQHDGGHSSYSSRQSVNRLMAMTLDMLGGSSYIWKWKHNLLHHNYSNIVGADDDIDIGPLGRLSPDQPHYCLHRFQHFYTWLLYGLLPFKWQLLDDIKSLFQGKIGTHELPRPSGSELVILVAGKCVFLCLAFLIPMSYHRPGRVVLLYVVTSLTLGFTLSVVFQLGHCVEEASFVVPLEGTNRIDKEWAVHQVATTIDFARGNPFLTWYLGGLNFQIEHHLFPQISHFHYPALSTIVEAACAEHGIKYFAHRTLFSALASHFRLLRRNAYERERRISFELLEISEARRK